MCCTDITEQNVEALLTAIVHEREDPWLASQTCWFKPALRTSPAAEERGSQQNPIVSISFQRGASVSEASCAVAPSLPFLKTSLAYATGANPLFDCVIESVLIVGLNRKPPYQFARTKHRHLLLFI